jgi:alpha-ketoglutarate-dependent taurine dioxygenase
MSLAATPLDPLPFAARRFPDGGPLPLVIEPSGADTDIAAWVAAHPDWAATQLRTHGALLFRGFPLRTPAEFERLARAISPKLQNGYLGTSPRDALTDYVFSASELPPYYPIPQHCEMSFTQTPPQRLFFHCMVAPTGPGGETPLVDFRRVLRDLDPAVRQRFEARGVRNIRNYDGPEGGAKFDLWKLKRWDEMFRTTDRAEVERICREQAFEYQWKSGGRLALVNTQPATRLHPETGEPVWFNHSQVFHLSAASGEFRRIARRQRPVQSRALALLADTLVAVKHATRPAEDQAMHCTYGDGSEIPLADMEAVRDAIWKNLVAFRWQVGDVVAIDNFAVSHGRLPYRGPRTITVCWA